MDEVEVDEDSLRRLYDSRIGIYRQPERRLLERLAFGTEDAAQAAFDAIAAGETDFDALVAERDLTLADVDLGEVAFEDLPGAAAEVIFADTESEIIGPLPSRLGPALYRVNAVLEATETSFEEARADLREELADDAARRQIAVMREEIDDLLASGATLEELAETTPMSLGQIDFTPASEDEIAAYDAFRDAALAVEERDFPEVLDLSDGGLFALRLDEIVPPTVPPLSEIEDEVAEAWRVTALREALTARADQLVGQIATGAALENLGDVATEAQVRRQDFIPGMPPTLVVQAFQLSTPGDVVAIPGARSAHVVRLDAVNPAARDAADTGLLLQILDQTVAQSMAQDIFEGYGRALQTDAGIRLDQSVINAVHAQFP
jgi:peptidyl-prolyl cis-trans isomerase D